MTPSDWAAWVQAAGSVIAIYAAGRVVELGARTARLEKLEGVHGVLSFAAATLAEASDATTNSLVEPAPLLDFPEDRLRDCEAMLSHIQNELVAIGSNKLPRHLSEALESVRCSRIALETAKTAIRTTRNIAASRDVLSRQALQVVDIQRTFAGYVEAQHRRVRRWWLW